MCGHCRGEAASARALGLLARRNPAALGGCEFGVAGQIAAGPLGPAHPEHMLIRYLDGERKV